ncbi:MAG TPA: hypothetical protein VFT43_07045 [Candidatus Polarisedimenticolia bacterium]|nr:hypothetical protein [Candidatus Polarisedimenticolia bacterium]
MTGRDSGRDAGPPHPPSYTATHDGETHAVIVRELERRLHLLDGADETIFGRFTALDWVVCVAAFVVLPVLLFWWGAGR